MTDQAPVVFEAARTTLLGTSGVAVRGEVDLAAGPQLEHTLDAAIRDSTGVFIIDLADVDFLDSTGLRILLRARSLLAREERELAVVCPSGNPRRLLDVAGVADLLLPYDSLDALAAAMRPRH